MAFSHVGILGVDVGGTFTDAVLVEDGRIATAKVPTSARQEESVLAAARAVGAGDSSASRTGRPSRRTPCSSARARVRPSSRPRGSSTSSTCGGRTRAHLYRLCERPPRAARAARALLRGRASGSGRRACSRPLDLESLPEIDAEAVAVCLLFSFRDPSHERAVADELRRRLPAAQRRRLARGRARVPRVRARLDDGDRRVSRARSLAGTSSASRERAPRPGFPSRSSCALRAGSRRSPRRPPIPPSRSSPVPPRASSARRSPRARPASRTRSPSTWAARRPTSR